VSIIPPATKAVPVRYPWPAWATPLACLPFAVYLGLAVFAYPQTDDWHLINVATHRGVIGGAWDYLTGWGGRFIVAPFYLVIGGLPGQWLVFPLVMAANIALFPWSLRCLLPPAVPRPWPVAIGLTGLLFASLPSPAQGLYWLAGMLAYVFPLHVFASAVALARPTQDSAHFPGKNRRWNGAALVALGVIIAGFGETPAILAGGSALLLASLAWRRAWWLAAGVAAGFALDLALPGNWARLAVVHPHGPVLSSTVLSTAVHGTARVFTRLVLGPECMTALVIAALAGAHAMTGKSTEHRAMPRPWFAPMVPIMVCAAIIPSIAALGVIEGRQADTIWIAALPWSLAGAWWLGAARPHWFCDETVAGDSGKPGILVGCALILVALSASTTLGGTLTTLAIGITSLAVIILGLLKTVFARQPSWLGLALAAAIAITSTFQTAVADLAVHAPARRHYQAERDRQVAGLAAAGAQNVRFPLANPDDFPATIANGDLLNAGRWDARDYAAVFGLESAGSDPRLDHAIATDAAGHALPPTAAGPTR
jgi:hypothetical protein